MRSAHTNQEELADECTETGGGNGDLSNIDIGDEWKGIFTLRM